MADRTRYRIPILGKSLDVLECFRTVREELTLEQVIRRTAASHTTAFRILCTLVERGYLSQLPGKKYRLNNFRRRPRLGFATLTQRTTFAVAVAEGLERAAECSGFEILMHDNDRDPQCAVANAKAIVAEGVDIAIEFQRHYQVAPMIADIFSTAGIPTIAILIPQPGAVYFGVNNYRAGLDAGYKLAEYAGDHWGGRFDLLVLVDIAQGGTVLQSRMTGVQRGMEEKLGAIPATQVVRVDGKGTPEDSARLTATALRRHPKARRILISAASDESALGARDAIRMANLSKTTAIIGHGGSEEVWADINASDSPIIGTVKFFPERYGRGLVELALRILRGEQVPPALYMPHEVVTRWARPFVPLMASRRGAVRPPLQPE
jgi:ribose transport system substrate-binding protein